MKKSRHNISGRLARTGELALNYIGIVILAVLFLLTVIFTVYFKEGYSEIPYYNAKTAVFVMIAITALMALWCLGDAREIQGRKVEKLLRTLMVFAFFFGSFWVMISHSFPVADRDHVSAAAMGFVNGDYSALDVGNYLYIYPYQLTYVAFLELCYYLMGNGYYFFPQMVNVWAAAMLCLHIYRLTEELFEDKSVLKIVVLLSFGGISTFFFTTYVYGNILGLFFSVWALRYFVRFMKEQKVKDMLAAAVLIGAGSLFKNNFIIFFLAMLITLALAFLKEKKGAYLAGLFVILLVRFLFHSGIEGYYESRSGLKIGDGQPMIASLAMGLRDDGNAPGWHTGFDINIYRESGFDAKITSETAKDSIYGSLSKMKSDPLYGIRFFFEKTVTQWCEPTYQSLWDSNCSDNHTMELSDLANSIYYGGWNRFFVFVMDVFQSLVWGLALFFLVYRRKRIPLHQGILTMIVIGGFIFQLFWEAKAQYNLQYMMVMLPYAACGMKDLSGKITVGLRKRHEG